MKQAGDKDKKRQNHSHTQKDRQTGTQLKISENTEKAGNALQGKSTICK